jgi:hypothetical protein
MTVVVVKPTTITGAMLVSTTLAEDSAAAWSSGTTYAAGDQVHLASTHRRYQSLQGSNTNHDPSSAASAAWWVDIGATNRWAMFDQSLGSLTVAPLTFSVTVAPGAITALALLQLQAAELRVTMRDTPGGATVYDQTFDLSSAAISDAWEYCFAPLDYRTEFVVRDLPSFGLCEVDITVTGDGVSQVQVGEVAMGPAYSLGDYPHNVTLGIQDYSRKSTDDFGVTTLVRRSYARKMDLRFVLDGSQLSKVYSVLSNLRATPCVWVPSDDATLDACIVYGWAGSFSIDAQTRAKHYCSLQVEGLT